MTDKTKKTVKRKTSSDSAAKAKRKVTSAESKSSMRNSRTESRDAKKKREAAPMEKIRQSSQKSSKRSAPRLNTKLAVDKLKRNSAPVSSDQVEKKYDLMNRPTQKLLREEVADKHTTEKAEDMALTMEEFEDRADNEHAGSDFPGSTRTNSYEEGIRTLKDCYAPDGIKVLDEKTLIVGGKYVRNYVMQGFPGYAWVGWLDGLFSHNGNLDTLIYIEPEEARDASAELTKQITQIQAQLMHETEKGSISNISKYQQEIARLEQERAAIEMNAGSFYKVEIFANLLNDTKDGLDKESAILESALQGMRMNFIPTSLRMVDGYRSALPTMNPFYEDKFRNFNTGAVGACFPFYNAEICHPGGVLFGDNISTGTPMYVNVYDKHTVANTNMSVFGRAGSGKSYFTKLLIMRSALQNIHTAIIDPEREYGQIARALGGIDIKIAPDSTSSINVFDVEEAVEVDDDGNPTGVVKVDLNNKIADLIDLFSVMAKGEITQEQRSLISVVTQKLYANFGITEDPESLFVSGGDYDPETGMFYSSGRRKTMPCFTDFHNLLMQEIELHPEYKPLIPFSNQMKMFRKEGAYGLFDCQSSINAANFMAFPIINFDVSALEEGTLRPIGMYIAMTYIWERFVKKDFEIRKRVVCDEAWMLMNQGLQGSEYTRRFLEKCARRIRKRNAGLLVASQNFIEFANCDEGKAVLSNTAVRIFLKQSDTDLAAVKNQFNLSNGEIQFLREADTGEFLLKTDTESSIGRTRACKFEHALLTNKAPVEQG